MATKIVHCIREPYDIYIGRGRDPKTGQWPTVSLGNPYAHKRSRMGVIGVRDREEAIRLHRELMQECLAEDPEYWTGILESLKGKTLGCWCKPLACHGDTLAEMADAL